MAAAGDQKRLEVLEHYPRGSDCTTTARHTSRGLCGVNIKLLKWNAESPLWRSRKAITMRQSS